MKKIRLFLQILFAANALVFICLSLGWTTNYGDSYRRCDTNLALDNNNNELDIKQQYNDVVDDIPIAVAAVRANASTPHSVVQAKPVPKKVFEQELLGCQALDNQIILGNVLGKGTTKKAFSAKYLPGGKKVVVKFVTPDVDDVKACKRRGKFWKEEECFLFANYKILKEIMIRQQLAENPYLIKLLGYCVRNEVNSGRLAEQGVVSITEAGRPVNVDAIQTLAFNKKLKLVEGMADFLDFMANSPLGSLILTDFKLSQMFIVEGVLKFGDLDDINNIEKPCSSSSNCKVDNKNFGILCAHSVCEGHNEKFNLYHFNRLIIRHILANPPRSIEKQTNTLLANLQNLKISARELHSGIVELQNLLNKKTTTT